MRKVDDPNKRHSISPITSNLSRMSTGSALDTIFWIVVVPIVPSLKGCDVLYSTCPVSLVKMVLRTDSEDRVSSMVEVMVFGGLDMTWL